MSFFRSLPKPTPPPLTATTPAPTQYQWLSASMSLSTTPRLPVPDLEKTWSNEKIVAYRTVVAIGDDGMWLGHYHPDGPSITTVRHGGGETMTAVCDRELQIIGQGCDPCPSMTCPSTLGDGCGWYAYKTKEVAQATTGIEGVRIEQVARVLLWGTVIEYTKGYRAQYLSVDKIYEIPDPKPASREGPRSGSGSYPYGAIPSAKMMQAKLATTITDVLAPPSQSSTTTGVCGESCKTCHGECARDVLAHVDHYCAIGVEDARRKGFKLL